MVITAAEKSYQQLNCFYNHAHTESLVDTYTCTLFIVTAPPSKTIPYYMYTYIVCTHTMYTYIMSCMTKAHVL